MVKSGNTPTLWLQRSHQIPGFSVPNNRRIPCHVPPERVVNNIPHDSRGRHSQIRAFYRGHTLGNGPRNDVGRGRTVGRTVLNVKKVNTVHAGYGQQPNAIHWARREDYSQLLTLNNTEDAFRMIYTKIYYIEREWRDGPPVNWLSACHRWDVQEIKAGIGRRI